MTRGNVIGYRTLIENDRALELQRNLVIMQLSVKLEKDKHVCSKRPLVVELYYSTLATLM